MQTGQAQPTHACLHRDYYHNEKNRGKHLASQEAHEHRQPKANRHVELDLNEAHSRRRSIVVQKARARPFSRLHRSFGALQRLSQTLLAREPRQIPPHPRLPDDDLPSPHHHPSNTMHPTKHMGGSPTTSKGWSHMLQFNPSPQVEETDPQSVQEEIKRLSSLPASPPCLPSLGPTPLCYLYTSSSWPPCTMRRLRCAPDSLPYPSRNIYTTQDARRQQATLHGVRVFRLFCLCYRSAPLPLHPPHPPHHHPPRGLCLCLLPHQSKQQHP